MPNFSWMYILFGKYFNLINLKFEYHMTEFNDILEVYGIPADEYSVRPFGNGLINDTYLVHTEKSAPSYMLQRINHNIFTDVEGLQSNIDRVTDHLRQKLIAEGVEDVDRRALKFLKNKENGKSYVKSGENYWRISEFIPESVTKENLNPESAYIVGKAFGDFEASLTELADDLVETIKDFHNMEFRLQQLKEALEADPMGRKAEVAEFVKQIMDKSEKMTQAEKLHREGKLPKRVCHCDTKLNNILFDKDDNILCVIDLDTVMPSFVFSDFGDFLRFAANTAEEDAKDLSRVDFNMEMFRYFAKGYLESATFLTELEKDMLPYAAELFPYMQAVRFLTDYINGDTYFKIAYPEHNLVRAKAQWKLFEQAEAKESEMKQIIAELQK